MDGIYLLPCTELPDTPCWWQGHLFYRVFRGVTQTELNNNPEVTFIADQLLISYSRLHVRMTWFHLVGLREHTDAPFSTVAVPQTKFQFSRQWWKVCSSPVLGIDSCTVRSCSQAIACAPVSGGDSSCGPDNCYSVALYNDRQACVCECKCPCWYGLGTLHMGLNISAICFLDSFTRVQWPMIIDSCHVCINLITMEPQGLRHKTMWFCKGIIRLFCPETAELFLSLSLH